VVIGGGHWRLSVYFRHGRAEALSFNTLPVTHGELTQTVHGTGHFESGGERDRRQPGFRAHQQAERGFNSLVTKGEVLAEIDPSPIRPPWEQVTADLANSRCKPGHCSRCIRPPQRTLTPTS